MNPRDDRRGVSTVVGAVLIFGIVVVLLSLYQAQVVPAQNEAVEFQHAQAVQTDMLHVRDGLLRTAASGSSYPTSVALGARYPSRIFFVNPPPVSGRIQTETVGGGSIVVSNATALDAETADYWSGTTHSFDSKSLVYEAEYTYLDNSPQIVYGNSLLYRNYTSETPNAYVVQSGPTVVDGSEITLVALGGSLAKSGVGSASVDPKPVSTPFTEITVTNANGGENVTVTLPTALPVGQWRTLLAEELDDVANDGDERRLLAVEDAGANAVRLVLEPGTYTLKMAKLGVGTGVERPGAHYLTSVRGDGSTVTADSSTTLVAQVRDRFNNPVAGQLVNATTDGTYDNDAVQPTSVTSGDGGNAAFTYEAPSTVSTQKWVNVTAWYAADTPSGATDRQKVRFRVFVTEPGGQPTEAEKVSYDNSVKTFGDSDSGVAFDVVNEGNSKVTITGVKVTTEASATNLHEKATGDNRTSREVYIDTGTDEGWYEAGDESKDQYELGKTVELSDNAVIEAGNVATVSMYKFRDNKKSVDMSGKQVTVTLYFSDGTRETYSFTTPA